MRGIRYMLLVALIVLASLASCNRSTKPAQVPLPAPTTPPRTPTPVPATDQEAIQQLLNAEAEAVVAQDINRLEEIWDDDGVVVDAKHTPNDPQDDARWQGWDAIRERYVVVVFPGAPKTVAHPLVDIKITGDTAVVTTTTEIGSEVAAAGDRWTFARRNGRWVITSLTYNLEPK
ncbi:MAG: DUF4440 domain-containing protein [Anaerolineae bacterium]|nr:DUF4440 domain-containing protein [Anaerolineae bacterium]